MQRLGIIDVAKQAGFSLDEVGILLTSIDEGAPAHEQLQALAARAKTDLTATLGAEAADAYAQRSQWMSMLQGGIGYSTTPTARC